MKSGSRGRQEVHYVLQHISDTSGASSVFTMRLMITSAWSRMRRREQA
jgi:hypothetical protein